MSRMMVKTGKNGMGIDQGGLVVLQTQRDADWEGDDEANVTRQD